MSVVRSPIAWSGLLTLALLRMALQLYGTTVPGYGLMSDELYYLDSAHRLAWGFVDHPPLSVALLTLLEPILGDSLLGLRFVASLFTTASLILAGLIARELGGGRGAQWLAAGLVSASPVLLGVSSFYSMNVIDIALTSAATYCVARLVNGAGSRTWWGLGVVLGLGLLNKYSMLWFGFGLAVGILATPHRKWVATPGPWIAATISVLTFLPHLFWQWQNGFPSAEFLTNAATLKVEPQSPLDFLSAQILAINPILFPVWLAGLAWLFTSKTKRAYRILGWIFITVVVILMASGSARIYYLGPCYAIVAAGAAVAVESWTRERKWVLPTVGAVAALSTLAVLPFSVPLFSGEQVRGLFAESGREMPKDTDGGHATMPSHLALQHHARPTLDAFEQALDSLPQDERGRAGILTDTFGSAAAVNVLGRDRLPAAIGVQNQYWLWGPGDEDGDILVVLWRHNRVALLHEGWEEVQELSPVECFDCGPFLTRDRTLFIVKSPRLPLAELWPKLKYFR